MSKRIGFILGKFYPLHIGHLSLIEFGLEQIKNGTIDKLIVLVDNHHSYKISLKDRVSCLKEEFPLIEVRGIEEFTLQEPHESPNFWNYWNKIIKENIPEKISLIIGSMPYIKTLANNLGIKYLLFDEYRDGINFSATQFRNEPKENWSFLSPSSKKLLCKKIAILGAESSGKSTLCKNLSNHYQTNYTPEFARTFIENRGRKLSKEDFLEVQKQHYSHHQSLIKFSNYTHFLDTEAITTRLWFNWFYPEHNDEFLNEYIHKQKIDLFIIIHPIDKWEKDFVRYQESYKERLKFFYKIKKYLFKHNKKFIVVKVKDFSELLGETIKQIENNGVMIRFVG